MPTTTPAPHPAIAEAVTAITALVELDHPDRIAGLRAAWDTAEDLWEVALAEAQEAGISYAQLCLLTGKAKSTLQERVANGRRTLAARAERRTAR